MTVTAAMRWLWSLRKGRRRQGGVREEEEEEKYFSVDLITCLLLASCDEFRHEDIIERAVALKKKIPFEMRHFRNRVVSTDDEIRTTVREFLEDGVRDGWIEAVTMRYASRCRDDTPLRLQEVLTDSPSLKDTLEKILAHIGLPLPCGLPPASQLSPSSSSTRDEDRSGG